MHKCGNQKTLPGKIIMIALQKRKVQAVNPTIHQMKPRAMVIMLSQIYLKVKMIGTTPNDFYFH
jgi:hypothetical protein